MIVLKLAGTCILGIILMGIWFGMEGLFAGLFSRTKLSFLMRFRHLFSSFLPTAAVMIFSHQYCLNVAGIGNLKYFLACIAIAGIASAVVTIPSEQSGEKPDWNATVGKALDGMLMEIPMRLMMQTFVWHILKMMGVEHAESSGILINALIWCSGIVIQNVISKKEMDCRFRKELTSSFIFSLGAGWLLRESDFIL